MHTTPPSLIEVVGLTVVFNGVKALRHRALRGVSLSVGEGETVALLGESGAGKTLLSHACLGLLPKSATISGQVIWRGAKLDAADRSAFQKLRGREIGMVFQDAQASLNPLYPVSEQLRWIVNHHRQLSGEEGEKEAVRLLQSVKLPDPERVMRSYPAELSGGMCQRVMIAMALASRPSLLIADEPTSALDISIASGIIALLGELKRSLGLAILFVTHDLGVAAKLADRILVMENGEIVEDAPSQGFLSRGTHLASRRLIDAYEFMNPRTVLAETPALSASERPSSN